MTGARPLKRPRRFDPHSPSRGCSQPMSSSIPLSKPDITQREIDAVVDVLHTDTLSIGPKIQEFEAACAALTGRRHAVGVSSGTAGLHCAMLAANVRPGDEV